jgi:glycosyltransferase involved in cell wall biosynthesis
VHYFSLKVMLAGSVAAQLAGVRSLVGTVTGQGILGAPGMSRLKVMLRHGLRLALPARAVLVFQNQDDRNAFITADIIDANRTAYIPGCGVDVARLAAQPIPRPAPKRFIHASRMLWSKGVAEFVEAARRVKRGRPEAEFALYGGCAEDYPSKNPDFIPRAWLEEVDQEGVVRWHGRVPSETIERTLLSSHSAAAALLSCYAEGVPRFLIEAAACGLPIITTDHPGCRDTVLPDRSGYLCHPESRVAGAARAMVWLLCDPAKQNRMGAAGREHAMQFDQGRVLADTLEVYRRMLR